MSFLLESLKYKNLINLFLVRLHYILFPKCIFLRILDRFDNKSKELRNIKN